MYAYVLAVIFKHDYYKSTNRKYVGAWISEALSIALNEKDEINPNNGKIQHICYGVTVGDDGKDAVVRGVWIRNRGPSALGRRPKRPPK
jgi:hypothetical protein